MDPYDHLTKLEAMRMLREKDATLREKDMEMEDLRIQAQVS